MTTNIILGTVKLGEPGYGFSSNKRHAVTAELLGQALELGIKTLDTSPRYGKSEQLIGEFHKHSPRAFKVCSKVDKLLPNETSSSSMIYRSVAASISKTRVDKLEVLYLHQNDLRIISDEVILETLHRVKEDGMAMRLGVSIYDYEELDFALNCGVYDVIQTPVSVLDSHIYSKLDRKVVDKEIIARSIFLQGTLFNRQDISEKIAQADDMVLTLHEIDALAKEHDKSLVDLACGFVAKLPHVKRMIVGTTCPQNLSEIVRASETVLSQSLFRRLKEISSQHKEWGNPRNW